MRACSQSHSAVAARVRMAMVPTGPFGDRQTLLMPAKTKGWPLLLPTRYGCFPDRVGRHRTSCLRGSRCDLS